MVMAVPPQLGALSLQATSVMDAPQVPEYKAISVDTREPGAVLIFTLPLAGATNEYQTVFRVFPSQQAGLPGSPTAAEQVLSPDAIVPSVIEVALQGISLVGEDVQLL